MSRYPALLLLSFVAAGAQASDFSCNVESDYDLTINDTSVILTRDSGTPKWIVIRQDRLFVDDRWVQLGPEDRKRIGAFDIGVREVMPLASRIGRDAADIAFIALGELAAGLSSDPERTRRTLERARQRIDARLARSVTANRFDEDALGEGIGEVVGEVLPTLVGDIVGGAVSAALTGDTSRFEAMDGLDRKIEAQIEPRAKALEKRADQLCVRMLALDTLDNALAYRLPDGSALNMLDARRTSK